MGHLGSTDLLTAVIRYAPLLFVIAGLLVLAWLARQRSPQDLQPDVLAALSDTEALPPWTIRRRPPLASQDVDPETLVRILEDLRCAGLAVRWYEVVSPGEPDSPPERQAVYRRIRRLTETAG
jgi:hypothetical protein